jgi:hypothetical protein
MSMSVPGLGLLRIAFVGAVKLRSDDMFFNDDDQRLKCPLLLGHLHRNELQSWPKLLEDAIYDRLAPDSHV